MKTFLEQLAEAMLNEHGADLRDVAVVLPSQRAGSYLREALARQVGRALWSPETYTLPAFMEHLSGLRVLPMEELLFEAYEAYRAAEGAAARPFIDFMEWAPVSLADMSEADANMIRLEGFYRDLRSWEEIDWSFNVEPLSDGQRHMLRYWSLAGKMHVLLNERLIAQGAGTSGLVSRRAAEAADRIAEKCVWFAGLNAFTESERRVIDRLRDQGKARFAWDADSYYLDAPEQEAGHHLRHAMRRYGPGAVPPGATLRPGSPHIEVIRVPNAVSQALCAAGCLRSRSPQERARTAIVLADEGLLPTLLEVLPADAGPVNVTMGLALSTLPIGSLLETFFHAISAAERSAAWSAEGVTTLLRHPLLRPAGDETVLDDVIDRILAMRSPWIPPEALQDALKGLGSESGTSAQVVLARPGEAGVHARAIALLAWARSAAAGKDPISGEQIHQAAVVLGRTALLLERYGHASDGAAWAAVMARLLRSARIGLFGEPLTGLQIMGLLEARGLDARHMILLGAQEGKLPSTSIERSYIPFELRRAYGLPMRDAGDAVQAYNFLRSIQRADSVVLVYDADGTAGGPSRFIEQLRHGSHEDGNPRIVHRDLHLPMPVAQVPRLVIPNDRETMERITALLRHGLSPSALRAWLRCPLDFWFRYVRGLKEPDAAGVRIGGDVLGNALHALLEGIHRPWMGAPLSAEEIERAIPGCGEALRELLTAELGTVRLSSGQPLLQIGMATRAAENFLRNEARTVRRGMRIVPLALESGLRLGPSIDGLPENVVVKGRLDRVDERDGIIHVLDLKTGRVDEAALRIKEISVEELKGDGGYAAQLLLYAWLYLMLEPGTAMVRTGLQPIQRASGSEGVYLRIGERDRVERSHLPAITGLIAEVVRSWMDPSTTFAHDPDSTYCTFCVR